MTIKKFRENNELATMVVGGSGFIGRHLVRKIAEGDRSVVSVYHRRLPEPLPNVYPVCSGLDSVDLLAAPLRGVETVYMLAWQETFLGSKQEIEFSSDIASCSSNLRMLKNLIDAMENAGTKRVIFLSALGASRRANTPFLKEKYLAEYAVLNSKIPEKLIIRSSLVYSQESYSDPFIRSILNIMRYPAIYPVPHHQKHIAPLHVDDLVDVLVRLGDLTLDPHSAILEVSGDQKYKIEDIFKMVSSRFVKGTKFQLRGNLGNSLLPMFEKKAKDGHPMGPKIRDYLGMGSELDPCTQIDNQLQVCLPAEYRKLEETLMTGGAQLPRVENY